MLVDYLQTAALIVLGLAVLRTSRRLERLELRVIRLELARAKEAGSRGR